ncbi:MAG: nucleotide exchange factor GrpE, partial [Bdellovibrionales bacterium]|nr:nucleotide exchange factor GrpE [Bdellovibrionales bacterium]
LHEALSSEETMEIPPGHITQVFKRAYKLHDRVIRPAQVVVAREVTNKE